MQTDSTQLKCFINCAHRYWNNYVRCLRKTEYEEESVDLRFGEAIHSALELFYKGHSMGEAIDKFKTTFLDLPGEDVKTLTNGIELLIFYENYHNFNFKDWEVLASESVNTIKLSDTLEYLVKIDLVVKWMGNIYVVDFKTTGSTRKATFFNKFQLDIQPTGYIAWCKEKFGQCSGFIPVAMYVGFRKRAYQGEPAGFHCDFDHTIINKTPEDIEDWKYQVIQHCKNMEKAKETGVWLKNTDYCSSYRGCAFKELCLSLDDETIKESLYSVYDSTEYLKKEGVTND